MPFFVAIDIANRNNSGATVADNNFEAVKTLAQKKGWKSIIVMCYEKLDGKKMPSLRYEIDESGNVTLLEKKEDPITPPPKHIEIVQKDMNDSMGFVMPFFACSSSGNKKYKTELESMRKQLEELKAIISAPASGSSGSSYPNLEAVNEMLENAKNHVNEETDISKLSSELDIISQNLKTLTTICQPKIDEISKKVEDLLKNVESVSKEYKGGAVRKSKKSEEYFARKSFIKRYLLTKK